MLTYICTHIYTYTHMCIHIDTCLIYVHTYIHIHTYTYIHEYICVHACMCVHHMTFLRSLDHGSHLAQRRGVGRRGAVATRLVAEVCPEASEATTHKDVGIGERLGALGHAIELYLPIQI